MQELVKSFQTSARIRRHSSNDQLPRNGIPREKIFRSHPSTTSLYGTDVVDETHRGLVDCIARHLIYDCAKACAIMSTNILAFLLLNKYRDGVRIEKLVISFDRLRKQLNSDSRDLGFSGNSIDVINNAVSASRMTGVGLINLIPDSRSRRVLSGETPRSRPGEERDEARCELRRARTL